MFDGGISLESLDGGLDVLLDLLVMGGALHGLASGFFGGFDNRHEISFEINLYLRHFQ